ncbi:g4209 [Coccomyxa elongata]
MCAKPSRELQAPMARTLVTCAAVLLCLCTFVHCSPLKSGTEELSDRLVSLRHLLETELTVANDNNTYPNTTINVGLSRPEGCIPWWTKTIRPTDLVCPKDCALSGFKEGYNLGQLAPLNIKVERGQVSRVAPRPLKGAFLNITGTSRIDNKADYKYQLSNYGVDYVQFAANYPVGARFTVYLGLVKKDPNAGGSPVADPQAKHSPFCFFNVTWTVVAPGSIPKPPAAAPAAEAEATTATSTKKPAAAAAPVAATDAAAAEATPPVLATSAKKPAAAAQAPVAAAAGAGKKPAAPAPAPDAQDLSDLGL